MAASKDAVEEDVAELRRSIATGTQRDSNAVSSAGEWMPSKPKHDVFELASRTVDCLLLYCLYPHDAGEQGMLPSYISCQIIHPSVVCGIWTPV